VEPYGSPPMTTSWPRPRASTPISTLTKFPVAYSPAESWPRWNQTCVLGWPAGCSCWRMLLLILPPSHCTWPGRLSLWAPRF
jgi:hypothetical protein